MTFFNKKEDVISIELTPYGRKLLSHGELKPAYYAFYDDDVLYDSDRGGFAETNSDSKTRILTETISMKPQAANFGVESNLSNEYYKTIDNHMPYPIGTSAMTDKKSAGWELIMLQKEIDSTVLTSSLNSNILSIPQINCKIEFTMSMSNINTYTGEIADLANSYEIQYDEDGNFIKVEDEQILFYLTEKNGFVNNDSFEVEVYLFEEDELNLKKLNFIPRQEAVVNDLLQTTPVVNIDPTPENIEYYINLMLDDEVPDEDICEGIDKLKESSIYLDLQLKCPDREQQGTNIYASTLGDVEECD
jgi:hypothetical protein